VIEEYSVAAIMDSPVFSLTEIKPATARKTRGKQKLEKSQKSVKIYTEPTNTGVGYSVQVEMNCKDSH
jgi:hypothetical protein